MVFVHLGRFLFYVEPELRGGELYKYQETWEEKMEMKMGYICFVRFTNEILSSREKFNALHAKTLKLAEKNKLKLSYAGTPWGTDDHGVYVFESDAGFDAWGDFAMEWMGSLKPGAFSEIANTRTIAVNIM